MFPSNLQLSSLGTLFPGRGLGREHREAGTEQGKDLGRMEVRQRTWFLRICCRDWDLISYALVIDAGEQEAEPLRAYQKPGSTVG